jgi:hypothetical protein
MHQKLLSVSLSFVSLARCLPPTHRRAQPRRVKVGVAKRFQARSPPPRLDGGDLVVALVNLSRNSDDTGKQAPTKEKHPRE